MTPEDEEFNRIEMESRIKQEYVRAMRKTTREEKISKPAVYEVPTESVQFVSISIEPVGWIDSKGNMVCTKINESCKPLYTTPQRTWVGLTDEEMKKTWYEMQNIMGWYSFQEISKAIEAKLKEKNNGC